MAKDETIEEIMKRKKMHLWLHPGRQQITAEVFGSLSTMWETLSSRLLAVTDAWEENQWVKDVYSSLSALSLHIYIYIYTSM